MNRSKEAKQLFFDITARNIKSCEELKGGLSNDVFVINDAYVIKLRKEYVEPLTDDMNEYDILMQLSNNKNVEKAIYYDYDKNIKLNKFIHAAKVSEEDYTNYQIILLSKALKKLHKTQVECKEFDPFYHIEVYKKESKEKLDQRYEKKIISHAKKLYEKEDKVLCHNDLVRNNLLFKHDDVVLVDFAFAGKNIIYFDLASFISENNLSKEQEELFLSNYFGSSYSSIKRKKVHLLIELEDILWFYWAKMMYLNTKKQVFEDIALEKLSRIKKHQEDKEF